MSPWSHTRGELSFASSAASFGVLHALTENATYPANKMAQFAYDSLVQFTSKELEDDITVLVMKYRGGK